MDDNDNFVEEFKSHSTAFFSERIEYTSVYALLLFWEKNDINPAGEVEALQRLFEELNYTVFPFAIPIDGSQQGALNYQVAGAIAKWSNSDSLILVYYAGHCDADSEGRARRSAFMNPSEEYGDPTLSWYITQQLLFAAPGDVILILDCCNAALMSKGDKVKGKFELLAASAKGVTTPLPGKSSYTSILLKTLRKHIKTGITASDLNRKIWEDTRITETPIHADLASYGGRSIKLQHLRPQQHAGFNRKTSSMVMFRASLVGDPTGLEIAEWLKSFPPKKVAAVDIDAIVLKARRLQDLTVGDKFPRTSIFNNLSPQAQEEIHRQLRGLNNVVSSVSLCAKNPEMGLNGESQENCHDNMERQVSAVCTAIETPVLEIERTALGQFGVDEGVAIAGVDEAVSLRQYLLETKAIPKGLEVRYEDIRMIELNGRLRSAEIKGSPVLVEFFEYDPDPSTGLPYSATVQQLQKMAALLCQPKRTSFHILPCVGYVHDRVSSSFGLIFQSPHSYQDTLVYVRLADLYRKEPLVPLGHRIQLASALATAVENFHRVGWVHKALRPDNIFFLSSQIHGPTIVEGRSRPERDSLALLGGVDLTLPYLSGFEYARAEAEGTRREEDHLLDHNIYCHPHRWSRPTVDYIKAHDVYSLGIVLFELALWKNIKSELKQIPKRPDQVRAHIEEKCKKKLPHQAGQMFADIIMICLTFGESTNDLNEYGRQRFFQTRIIEKLQRAVGKL